jgi:hypothetical protein
MDRGWVSRVETLIRQLQAQRVVTGRVTGATGAMINSTGSPTSARVSAGSYDLTWPEMRDIPAISIQVRGGTMLLSRIAVSIPPTVTGCRVVIATEAGVATDSDFDFQVIGLAA